MDVNERPPEAEQQSHRALRARISDLRQGKSVMAVGFVVVAFPLKRRTDAELSGGSIKMVAGVLKGVCVSPDRVVEPTR